MTVDAMRTYISDTYNSPVVRGRNVCDMCDSQVIAIYNSLIRRGRQPVKKSRKDIHCEQMNFFELIGGMQNG